VRFAGITHPGIVGCIPSAELLKKWNDRERALIATNPNRVPPLALPPDPTGVILGSLKGEALKKAAMEAARTIPPREHGGNCDIKNLSRGSRVYLPVYVKGGGLVTGDFHFSQGDGEITFCGAIEMGGWIDFGVDLIKGGCSKYGITQAMFETSPVDPKYGEFLVFEGISIEDDGTQRYNDTTLAYRRACIHAINYLKNFGFTGEQAYTILSTAPVEGRVSGVVDIPNACVSLYIPTAIFDFDIRPNAKGPSKKVGAGDLARAS
jgi:formamidase